MAQQVTSSMDHPLHLSSIRIPNPPPNTRPSFLNSLISPFVSPASSRHSFLPSFISPAPPFTSSSTEDPSQRPPQTLREILVTTRTLVNHLRQFDIFYDQIDVKLEPARGGAIGDVDMVLGLRERGRLFFKGGTEIGGGEGGAVRNRVLEAGRNAADIDYPAQNATAKLRNVFGGAESLEVNAAYGTKTKSAYQVSPTCTSSTGRIPDAVRPHRRPSSPLHSLPRHSLPSLPRLSR
jgi:outer membrane protein insertion porin family